ncbi:PREDICTED: kinetochore-associated protein DSN1 homolog [Gavialis gangeticus]|uniref:kinetochore-associated protein DSN1 homolog n=1 Tax=Gavialis gangeticus TaxID=94835 RepID=UPI00092E5D2C|nr:PREDICTED: kinetochore-associated protein DSN1 homolog [Gavialis gangeticus]
MEVVAAQEPGRGRGAAGALEPALSTPLGGGGGSGSGSGSGMPRGGEAGAEGAEPWGCSELQKVPSPGAAVRARAGPCERAERKRSWSDHSPTMGRQAPSPKQASPWKGSPRKALAFGSPPSSSRSRVTRRSWRRSSLKGTKRRKSLPPFHPDVTELSKSISLDLPGTDRLAELLLSSFQFSAQKLECALMQTDGFSPEAFRANRNSVLEELKRCIERLKLDGTLKKCTEETPGVLSDPALGESLAQIKEYIARFSVECQSWDQLVISYEKMAEEMPRQLEKCKANEEEVDPADYLGSSQAKVINSKPDYQRILDSQSEVFDCMELVLDEMQMAVKLLQAFMRDSTQYLQNLSEQLASRTFCHLENSPARKLLGGPRKQLHGAGIQQPPEG